MSKTRKLFTEALNPLNKIASSIIKKLNYIESSLILKAKSFEEAKELLQNTASYHSNAFDDLNTEQQDIIVQKIWNTIHKILGSTTETPVNETNNAEELENKIYNFLKTNGGILYPLELSAKKLAKAITEN